MSPLCPRCGESMVQHDLWLHEHATTCPQAFLDGMEHGVIPPKADGRESGATVVATSRGTSGHVPDVTTAANPVRRFFAGPCKRCGYDIFLTWQIPVEKRGQYFCSACYAQMDTAEGWA